MAKHELIERLEKDIEELCALNNIFQEITLNVSKPDFMNFIYDTIYSITGGNSDILRVRQDTSTSVMKRLSISPRILYISPMS